MSDKIIWSNGNNEYFDEYCKDAYEFYLSDPEFSPYSDGEYEDFDEFQEQNFDSLWEIYQEDCMESWDLIAEMIHKQINNYLYAVGTDTVWHGSYEGYKQISYGSTIQPYDIDDRADVIDLLDENGNIWVKTYNHDGGMSAGLYTDNRNTSAVDAIISEDVEELADKLEDQYDMSRSELIESIYEDFICFIFDDGYLNLEYEEDELEQIAEKYNISIHDFLIPIKVQW